MSQLQEQLRRAKVINVPHYDQQNDRFVFDDGKVVANNDPIFQRFKWAWYTLSQLSKPDLSVQLVNHLLSYQSQLYLI